MNDLGPCTAGGKKTPVSTAAQITILQPLIVTRTHTLFFSLLLWRELAALGSELSNSLVVGRGDSVTLRIRVRPIVAILAQVLRVTGRQMECGSRDAAARRRRAKAARIGYAIRQARHDRAPRLPIRWDGPMTSADAWDSVQIESKPAAEDSGGGAPTDSPPEVAVPHAETPAATQRFKIPSGRDSFPLSREKADDLERRAAPDLFDEFTEDGNLSAVLAVRLLEWRLPERQRQTLVLARSLDVDSTQRVRCPAAWAKAVGSLMTVVFADISPEFDVVLRRARDAGDFDFSAVPLRGRWGWRRRARLAGHVGLGSF